MENKNKNKKEWFRKSAWIKIEALFQAIAHLIDYNLKYREMAILSDIAVWPLVCLIIVFAVCAIYYCVKTELKNGRKIGASTNEEAEEENVTVVVKKISGKILPDPEMDFLVE